MRDGFYYLHTNGEMIFKRFEPESDSPFVKKVWALDISNRMDAWKIALEGLFLGARTERIEELAKKWGLTFEDSIEMLMRRGKPSGEEVSGLRMFIKEVLKMSEEEYWEKAKRELKNFYSISNYYLKDVKKDEGWATRKEQANNKSNNKTKGEKHEV